MTLMMFDIGEIETAMIECTADGKPELHVSGINGRVTISLDVKVGLYSRYVVIPARLPCGIEVNIFDVRLLALFLENRYGVSGFPLESRCAIPFATYEVKLKDKTQSWRIVKHLLLFENGGCALDFGYGQEVWVNSLGSSVGEDGSPVPEPAQYFGELVTVLAFGIRNNPTESNDLLEGLPDLVGMLHLAKEYKRINNVRQRGITGHDFKTLYEYYDAIVRAAKTINHHIEKGDFHPNIAKLAAFESVDRNVIGCLEECVKRSDYARHLFDCRMSIFASQSTGYQLRALHVHRFNPLRFPDTKIWWE